MVIYLQLFWEFFKVGLFAVGGGLATVPFLYEMGMRKLWFTSEILTDMIAISESTPGPIGINMATYIGYHTSGIFGSICSTIGIVLPSFVIIIIIASFLKAFKEKPFIKVLMYILRSAVIGLLFYSFYQISLVTFLDKNMNPVYLNILVFIVFLVLIVAFKKVHPIVWIVLGSLVGIFLL